MGVQGSLMPQRESIRPLARSVRRRRHCHARSAFLASLLVSTFSDASNAHEDSLDGGADGLPWRIPHAGLPTATVTATIEKIM